MLILEVFIILKNIKKVFTPSNHNFLLDNMNENMFIKIIYDKKTIINLIINLLL